MANNDDLVANDCKIVPSLLPCGTQLSPEWKAITTTDQRVYFVNRRTRSSHWFPSPEFWVSKLGLPYGWEAALDHQSKKYYINHLTRTTTREDPRSEADQAAHFHMTLPQARRIELIRDAKIGFGFVAGSEKPVVIRSVIPNGPSDEKLFANDQILKVNGQDVRDAAQADVISLIKNAIGSIELEVIASEDVQDSKNQHNRKSSLMSRTTRERRRSTPVSVRFADEPALVQVIGPMEPVRRSSVPLIPNVLKVFLENGQTRSFRYDSNTTAEEIFCSFSSKLDLKLMEHFSLVLTGPKKGQISYIQNNEKIAEIFTNRNCSSVNCLCKFNIAFVPKDLFELLSQDRNTFEYLYAQVTNRVVEGFHGMDLKYDLAIKLAALQIQQKAMEAAAGRPVKISVRQVEKEFGGLAKFVTSDLLHNMREKELRKILDQQIKQNENLASPGEKYMSSLQCKLHYLNLSAEMFSYGGSYFDAELVDNGNEGPSLKKPTKKQHITVLINLKYGVSQVVRGKVNVLCQLAEFHEITGFAILVHEDNKRLLRIKLQEGKKIQLICTTVDCLDMITLITGYYKVYVDNTSNTPLPVENEEKWPFAFRRDPPVNDALPDFHSRHRVVPDVWSYPSCFQTSNAKRKTQVENSKPAPKDVFLDLSRAPPRFNETAIFEEPEEHNMVLEETDQNQVDETALRRESLNREDLSTPNLQYQFDACISEMQQDDLLEIDMSDKDQKLLDTTSSLLKNTSEDNVDANDEMQSDAVSVSNADAKNEDFVALDKRQYVFEKENVTRDSVKTTPTEHDNQEDLNSERILAEEIWQEEEAGTVLGEREEHIEDASSFSTWATEESDSSAAVEMKSEETCTKVEDSGEPVQLSTKIDHSSQSERTLVENKGLLASLPSGGTVDVNHNLVISPITQTASGTDESECTAPEVFDADEYPHLGLSVQHDPLIDTGPFQDRSATPSSKDLVWDSNLDNEGNELADSLGHEIAPEGFFERESDAEKPAGLDGIRSDGKGSESPVAFRDSDEFELTSDSGSVRDSIGIDSTPVDLDNSADIVASHMVCLEFDADSDTETVSTLSDEDESLWSIFPEYFPPSRRLRYSNNKQAELLLAQEDQDTDGLDCTETDQEVALVGVKELITACKSNSQDTVDISDKQDGVSLTDDSEELSTASSESFEYTYEVNAEFPSESEEVSEDSGYVNLTENNERRIQEICNQRKDANSFSSQDEMVQVARDKCISDKCDVPLSILSDPNDKISKVSGTMVFSSAEITSLLDPEKASGKKECAEMLKDSLEEHPPRARLENGSSCSFVDDMSKDAFLEKTRVLSEGWRSLNYSDKEKGRILDRDFSPSDWIIPSPPSPTPELLETDLCIVSPPPRSPTLIEDDLDAELKHLIVPPPPPSEDTLPIVSGIRIVSPPPLEVDDDELDHLLYNYDDNRFLSLTVDRKIAKNNVLISTRNFDSNLNEDKKIQAQKVKADASSISNVGVNENKTIGMLSIENSILDSSENSRNTVQTSVEPSSTTNLFTTRALNSQCSLPNPLTNCSDALDNSPTTLKRFYKEMSDDHLNKDNIRGKSKNPITTAELNSLSNCGRRKVSVENRSRFPLKQKPPVPPKPRIFRAPTDDGMYGSVKSSNVKVQDSADSGVKWAPEICNDSILSKETSSVKPTLLGADEQVTTRASCGDTSALNSQTAAEDIKSRKEVNLLGEKHGTRRSSSFACGSPHVPAPYASSRSQSHNSAESSVVSTHKFTPHTASLLLEQVPTVNSSASAGSTLFARNKERPPLMRNPASHTSLQDSHGDLSSNASGDGISRVLTHPLEESPISQLSAVNQQEDNCNNSLTSPPPPDSPPPPLPESSPPKLIPEFNAGDFDFGESPLETFQDDSRNKSPESDTFGPPSSAKELKSKRPLTSLDYKQGDSRSNFSERREKPHGVNTLSRSITVTSFPPEITQRSSSEGWTSHRDASFPNCGTKRSSFPFDEFCNLKDITATGLSSSLQEHQSLKAKCVNVCEEGLSKVIALEKRLGMCLNREASKPQFFNEVKNWPLIFQNNARFLACDIKVISSSVRRGSPQVVSAVETSLDALEKLIESCEKTCLMLNENQNGHSLVAMVRDVLERYRDIIFALKIACGRQPDHPDVEVLIKRTNAMATLIASLIRELRNY